MIPEKFITRISSCITDTEECIITDLPTNVDGYVHLQTRDLEGNKVHMLGHRISFELYAKITLSPSIIIMHTCDNPKCINPRHLKAGTHNDNVQDRVTKGRSAKGKSNGRYKQGYYSKYDPVDKPKAEWGTLFSRSLTKEQVLFIRKAILNKGTKSLKKLSEELGIKYQTIRDLNSGRTYKDV